MKTILKIVLILISILMADFLISWFMKQGIDKYYGLKQDSKILLIGHSHLMLATDKEQMEKDLKVKVSKYCREGVNVGDKDIMIKHFVNSKNSDSLKLVLYGVDLYTFTGEGLSKNSYKLFYPFLDNKFVDEYVKSQTSPFDYWERKIFKSYRFNNDGIINSAFRGWLNNWENFKSNTININAYKRFLATGQERHIQMNPFLIKKFDESVTFLTNKGIKVILVNTPTLDILNQREPEAYENIILWFKKYAEKNSLVEFWDFNPKYQADYSIFSDRLHMNKKGQFIISKEITDRIYEQYR